MEQVRLGRTNLMVSNMGFGGIPIQRVTEDEAVAVVRKCLELGVTFIDTANGYTSSEERIGKAISGQRDRVIIATKTHAVSPREVENDLKLSLKRLGTEFIDLYQFHNISNIDGLKMILELNGAMAVVEKAKRAGLVRHIGASTHSMDMAKELVKSGYFETIMFPFNFITCEAGGELLPLAREYDVGFIAMKPLAGGRLDNVTIAFKYLLQFSDIVINVGIEKISEIEEVVSILDNPQWMTATEQQEMERLRQELGTRFCRRCDYCQPCTQDISISSVMTFPSRPKRLPPERLFSEASSELMEKAASCIECGDCEERCPYNLPIREMIAEYIDQYRAEKKKYLSTLETPTKE
ncbi:aldo/keto reductase [Chloroflexota bacterium]